MTIISQRKWPFLIHDIFDYDKIFLNKFYYFLEIVFFIQIVCFIRSTDVYLYAVDPRTNSVVDMDVLQR